MGTMISRGKVRRVSLTLVLAMLFGFSSLAMADSLLSSETDDSIKILRKKRDRGDRDRARDEARKKRPDRTEPRRPRRPDRTEPRRPRRPDRTEPRPPRRPDRTEPRRPRRPDRTEPRPPRRPDRTEPRRPRRPDRTEPRPPRRPDRTEPRRPRRPDRTEPRPPRRPDRTEPRPPRRPDRGREDRIRRDRERADRIKKRRRQARRESRLRDSQRRNHRRDVRKRYKRHRKYYRVARRVIRRHYRWTTRYNRWWRNVDRWGHPRWPDHRITYPGKWPSTSLRWTTRDIINVADNLESEFAHIYSLVYDGRIGNTVLAQKAYELWHAAQVYSDAVEYYNSGLYYSVYELFNLEEKVLEFRKELDRYPRTSRVRSHFDIGRYYVNELLWQYRQQLGPIDNWRDRIDEDDNWRNDSSDQWDEIDRSNNNQSFYFWWSKPHRQATWSLPRVSQVDTLTIEVGDLAGQRGKNGVAGISHIILKYVDGSEYDLVRQDHSDYSHRSDQLVLRNEGDFLRVINPNPEILVREIEIQADSWVAPNVDVELMVNLSSYDLNLDLR